MFKKKCNWNHNLRVKVIKFAGFLHFCCSFFLEGSGDKEVETLHVLTVGMLWNRSAAEPRQSKEASSVWPSFLLSLGPLHGVLCIRRERIQIRFMNCYHVAPVV